MMIRKFVITTSLHGMKCLSIDKPSTAERAFLKRAIVANMTSDPFYLQKLKADPFLQSDGPDYMLIEFWKPEGAEEYVDFLNSDNEAVKWVRTAAINGLMD